MADVPQSPIGRHLGKSNRNGCGMHGVAWLDRPEIPLLEAGRARRDLLHHIGFPLLALPVPDTRGPQYRSDQILQ